LVGAATGIIEENEIFRWTNLIDSVLTRSHFVYLQSLQNRTHLLEVSSHSNLLLFLGILIVPLPSNTIWIRIVTVVQIWSWSLESLLILLVLLLLLLIVVDCLWICLWCAIIW
jgi:hypothetical protein